MQIILLKQSIGLMMMLKEFPLLPNAPQSNESILLANCYKIRMVFRHQKELIRNVTDASWLLKFICFSAQLIKQNTFHQ